MPSRETKEQKAVRLIADQRVRFSQLSTDGCRAIVRGDTGDYVTTLAGRWQCTCQHSLHSAAMCSHIMAVSTIYRAVVAALGG